MPTSPARWPRTFVTAAFCFLSTAGCFASSSGAGHSSSSDVGAVLPLTHLKLYETGVGYFERAGKLEADNDASLPVPAAHVDDAIKSLVVLDQGGTTRISGIEFSSVLSHGMARALASLPLGSHSHPSYGAVLESLRGLEVELEVAAGSDEETQKVSGTLLDVSLLETSSPEEDPAESGVPDSETGSLTEYQLTVLDTSGALRRFTTNQVVSVVPRDPTVAKRLEVAATALSKRAAQLRRDLRVVARGSRAIRIGYIAEAPVWRATYRLMMPESGTMQLQGWALLHNDTDENWHGVAVDLVNGEPDSFLFPLSAPRYSRRQLALPSEVMSTVPQLARHTADALWGDHIDDDSESGGLGLAGEGYGGGGYGQGFGAGHGRLGGIHASGGPSSSKHIVIGNLAELQQASGEEHGALFSYRLPSSLSLRAHSSTLVPFLDARVQGTRVTWFAHGAEHGRSAVVLVNASPHTLPPGTIAVYDARGFAGESALVRLKPGERQLFEFATDLDVELKQHELERSEQTKHFEFDADEQKLNRHFISKRTIEIEITNRAAAPREVHVGLGVRDNASVTGADRLDYQREQGGARAVIRAAARGKSARTLVIAEALVTKLGPSQLSSKELQAWAGTPGLAAAQATVLQQAATELTRAERTREALSRLEQEQNEIKSRQQRLHDHQKQLSDADHGALGSIVQRLLELEDQLQHIDLRKKALSEELDAQHRLVLEVFEALR